MAGEAKRGPTGFEGLSSEQQARFRQLWQGGANADDIAAEFKIARRTVYLWGAKCGVARCAKRPGRRPQRWILGMLRLTGQRKAKAARIALAAGKRFDIVLFAAAPHLWLSLSEDERRTLGCLALAEFGPAPIENAGAARRQHSEAQERDALTYWLVGLMLKGLDEGGEAAERVIAALNSAGADPAAQAAWREEAEALAPFLKAEVETFERHRRREAARWRGKGIA